MYFLILSLVPAQDPVISGPVPSAPTALDVNRLYNYTCTSSNGYLAANISWKLGTSLGNSIDVSPSVSGRTFRVSESTVTNSDSTLTKVSTLSLVPITDDHGKLLFCVTSQSTAPGATVQTITKSTSVSVFVQRRSTFIFLVWFPRSSLHPECFGNQLLALHVHDVMNGFLWRKEFVIFQISLQKSRLFSY